MAVELQMGLRVVVMVEACNEAEAPSCRVIARGSCVFPAAGAWASKVGRLAAASQQQQGDSTTARVMDGRSSRRKMEIVMVME